MWRFEMIVNLLLESLIFIIVVFSIIFVNAMKKGKLRKKAGVRSIER